jgi:hypothetical protein
MSESIGNNHDHPFVRHVSLIFFGNLAGLGTALVLLIVSLVWSGVLAW